MRALKQARKQIERDPGSRASELLSSLVLALEGEQGFDVKQLYELDYDSFQLALELLQEWRLDRYFSAKFRLMDASLAAHELRDQVQD
jgi:hypothetical protein